MKLRPEELQQVRQQGVYITEKCDGCGKLLNQSVRQTIIDRPEVYCCGACRDVAFFTPDDLERAAHKEICLHCRGHKGNTDSPYCDMCRPIADPTGRLTGKSVPTQCALPLGGRPPVERSDAEARAMTAARVRRHRTKKSPDVTENPPLGC